jgi:hypothetical protein
MLPTKLRPTDETAVPLPGGTVYLPTCYPVFRKWTGLPPSFAYGGKPILAHDQQPVFAELLIAQLFGHHPTPGHRSDGGSKTQSRTGHACNRHDGQGEASQARSRSAPAIIASTGRRRPKKEGGAQAGHRRDETAKKGIKASVTHFGEADHWRSVECRTRLGRMKYRKLALGLLRPGASVVLGAYFFRRRCSSNHSSEPG